MIRLTAPPTCRSGTEPFGLRPADRLTRADVDAVRAHFAVANRTRFLIQVPPGVEVEAGALDPLRPLRGWSKLVHHLTAVPEVGAAFEIRRATEDAARFAATGCDAFGAPPLFAPLLAAPVGRPGWSHYLALDAGRAVAIGAMYAAGDVAWLGVAATLATDRRRGAQQALLAARLRDARSLGLRAVYSEGDQDLPDRPGSSVRNMLRLGFDLLYHRENFGP
ncbi:MAG: hypothetical protein U0527_09985 [Candidatus Eisenbacteria bacterium]